MVHSVQPTVNLAEASSFGEDWLPITRFNEGEVYASRRAHAVGTLAQVRHRGLRLDGVLCYEVFGAITSDVAERRGWAARFLRNLKDLLSSVRHNVILRDVARRPTLRSTAAADGEPDQQIWVVTDGWTRRRTTAQLGRIIGDAPHVLLEPGPQRSVGAMALPWRLLTYATLLVRCAQPFESDSFTRNHVLARTALWAGDLAHEARVLFRRRRPAGLFVYQDYTTEGNVFVQVARELSIPTYSTQSSIHPEFHGPNYRIGNLEFENTTADCYVCWGEFSHRQMEARSEPETDRRRVLVHSRPTSPTERQYVADRDPGTAVRVNKVIVSLMGLRQEQENAALLRLAMQLAHQRSLSVSIRPHPSLDRAKYTRFVEQLGTRFPAPAEVTDARVEPQPEYTTSTLALTGLTSMYYENLFFGVPTVFFDYGVQLANPLPRAMPGVRNSAELHEQVDRIEAMTWEQWYGLADPVCELVYNRKCGDFRQSDSVLDLVNQRTPGKVAGPERN